MDIEKLQRIEKFLFEHKKKDTGAAFCAADITGVCIGLKPSAVINFTSTEMENTNCLEFRDLLENIGLKSVFYCRRLVSINKLIWVEMIFISKDLKMAIKLRDEFIALWITMDDFGLVTDRKTWAKVTKRIGKLLGYPGTATESFVRNELENRNGDDLLTIVGGKYGYFAHSKKYAGKEAKMYDEPMNKALKKYVPKTFEICRK